MKSKSKLIISITGIIIVTLALIGITYGYYQTKVTGNPTGKSIEVVTGNVAVTYTDLTESDVSEIITPGYEHIKLFTVQNTGNVEAKYSIALMDVINTFNRTQDITYTLYRNAGNNTINTTTLANYETVASGIFPTSNAVIKVDEIITTPNSYYTYALKINYVNSVENQNEDQGKTFSGKVQILATDNLDDYNPFDAGTLAYKIFDNGADVLLTSGTTVNKKFSSTTPDFSEVADGSDESNVGLFSIDDGIGTSYYFRGPVKNNYVNFNEMCWRIIRIEGDGSIRLVLASQYGECQKEGSLTTSSGLLQYDYQMVKSWGSLTYETSFFVIGGLIYDTVTYTELEFNSFPTNSLIEINVNTCKNDTSIYFTEEGTGCDEDGDGIYTYEKNNHYKRVIEKNPKLECSVGTSKSSVLTADEIMLAGQSSYIIDNVNNSYWTGTQTGTYEGGCSPSSFVSTSTGSLFEDADAYGEYGTRPVIALVKTTQYNRGTGLQGDPYVIG